MSKSRWNLSKFDWKSLKFVENCWNSLKIDKFWSKMVKIRWKIVEIRWNSLKIIEIRWKLLNFELKSLKFVENHTLKVVFHHQLVHFMQNFHKTTLTWWKIMNPNVVLQKFVFFWSSLWKTTLDIRKINTLKVVFHHPHVQFMQNFKFKIKFQQFLLKF